MVKLESESKKRNAVSIAVDDSDDDDLLLDMTPIFSKKKKSPDSVASTLQPNIFGAKKEETEEKPSAFAMKTTTIGTFNAIVVRNAHGYQGTGILDSQHDITLVRDLGNGNNPSAIKAVDKKGFTQGHLPYGYASILAPLLDKQGDDVTLSANATSATAAKEIPVNVTVVLNSHYNLTKAEIKTKARILDPVLKKLGWKSSVVVPTPVPMPVKSDPVVEVSTDDMVAAADETVPQVPARASFADFLPADVDTSEVSNGEINEEKLDHMFEALQKQQLSNLPQLEMPKHLGSLHLYDYQKNGILWLYQQETEGRISPFFEAKGGRYFCTVSRVYQRQKPLPIRGSVLADDMGLGKTIQTLGLILLNPPRGQCGYPYVRRSDSTSMGPRTTLIVAPLSVMANWIMQIEKHINKRKKRGVLVVSKYHGPKRESQIALVQYNQIDILITSYNTLAYDYKKFTGDTVSKKNSKAKKQVSIFDITFHRVVLDEAHIIRNSKTGFFKVAQNLKTNHKLCLTGTPFVNKPEDIHSLLSFLNVEPLCNNRAFKQAITDRIQRRDPVGLSTLRTSLAFIALRRNKVQVHSTIKLVSKEIIDRIVEFPPGENKRIHDMLYLATRSMFLSFLRSSGNEGIGENYMAFLELVLRVRQACCHGGLVPKERLENASDVLSKSHGVYLDLYTNQRFLGMMKKVKSKHDEGALDPLEAESLLNILRGIDIEGIDGEKEECAICLEVLEEESVTILRECKHIFCEACLQNVRNQVCPLCRTPFSPDDIITKATAEESSKEKEKPNAKKETTSLRGRKELVKYALEDVGRSPKIDAMFDEIGKMKPDEKGVIFSQWTSFLDIIENYFIEEGITYTRLDGSMSADTRVENMEAFDTEGCDSFRTPRFILCSLMACGTGINLTRGNVVFLTDPWWNAAAASQAMDRVHRIGQSRPVRVIRFIMKDSIETRMMALQESKSCLGKGSLQKLQNDEKRKARLMTLHQLLEVNEVEDLWA